MGNEPLHRMTGSHDNSNKLSSQEKVNFFMEYKKQIQLLPKGFIFFFTLTIFMGCLVII